MADVTVQPNPNGLGYSSATVSGSGTDFIKFNNPTGSGRVSSIVFDVVTSGGWDGTLSPKIIVGGKTTATSSWFASAYQKASDGSTVAGTTAISVGGQYRIQADFASVGLQHNAGTTGTVTVDVRSGTG